ncbi:MAG TPA: amidohydrolase [Gammaproteobacteria bacterium]|nr:amidohydrolase [Chromatiales bacterium]MCP4925330.1 amidohydrolase [Gammaproteobacteria bacterium]MDP7154107.1 amidohydrolase [Gammaproteobacteria bacterium]MDP7296949.1 amidohydrolase [Gammaproteobacteria bacterium]MDP7659647.1 amidohydrolase [Gammaproteobacteria bacterium]
MQDLNVTLIQATLDWHDAGANRARFSDLIGSINEATDLVVLPETFTTGFTMDTEHQAETMDGDTVSWLKRLAQDFNTTICGSLIIEEHGHYYNRLIWAPPDGQLASYDKRHLFRPVGERDHFTPGRERSILTINGWRICPLICYDLRFPVFSRGVDAYDLLLYIANWPTARRSAWRTLLPARAVENLCYTLGVNRIGTDGNDVEYAGDSMVVDFFGSLLADCDNQEHIVTTRLDANALQRYRKKFPAHLDADHYQLDD